VYRVKKKKKHMKTSFSGQDLDIIRLYLTSTSISITFLNMVFKLDSCTQNVKKV
jgi:hypothetical protein